MLAIHFAIDFKVTDKFCKVVKFTKIIRVFMKLLCESWFMVVPDLNLDWFGLVSLSNQH